MLSKSITFRILIYNSSYRGVRNIGGMWHEAVCESQTVTEKKHQTVYPNIVVQCSAQMKQPRQEYPEDAEYFGTATIIRGFHDTSGKFP